VEIRITGRRMAPYYDRPTLLHIQGLKGHDGSQNYDDTRENWHDAVKSGVRAYVLDSCGNKAYLEARLGSPGHKYVETMPDHTKTDNLLRLPTY
jgi:hypothetical protein